MPHIDPLQKSCEAIVQIRASSYSPGTLRQMQRIFDEVWFELEHQRSPHTFPWSVEATRYTIARLVLQHVNDLREPGRVKREVLASLRDPSEPGGD